MDKRSRIFVSELKLWVNLGNSEQEKYNKQCINLDLIFYFSSPPKAIKSDNIKDTYCYSNMISLIKNYIKDKNFNLIEKLAYEICSCIKKDLISKGNIGINELEIKITKLSPPVENINGGISFSYFEMIEGV